MSKKQQTARQQYIRVLESAATQVSEFPDQDTRITGELVGSKYLEGKAVLDHDGVPSIGLLGITVEGRLFLQKLKAEEKAESLLGVVQKHGSFITGLLVGAFVSIVPDLIKSGLSHAGILP